MNKIEIQFWTVYARKKFKISQKSFKKTKNSWALTKKYMGICPEPRKRTGSAEKCFRAIDNNKRSNYSLEYKSAVNRREMREKREL
ncbi:MAG: hypothetical protein KHW93_08520 [Butyricicoccus pullicaecorum]|nr:hypothetical protein [Butyricicoccus pullicaecorum]